MVLPRRGFITAPNTQRAYELGAADGKVDGKHFGRKIVVVATPKVIPVPVVPALSPVALPPNMVALTLLTTLTFPFLAMLITFRNVRESQADGPISDHRIALAAAAAAKDADAKEDTPSQPQPSQPNCTVLFIGFGVWLSTLVTIIVAQQMGMDALVAASLALCVTVFITCVTSLKWADKQIKEVRNQVDPVIEIARRITSPRTP